MKTFIKSAEELNEAWTAVTKVFCERFSVSQNVVVQAPGPDPEKKGKLAFDKAHGAITYNDQIITAASARIRSEMVRYVWVLWKACEEIEEISARYLQDATSHLLSFAEERRQELAKERDDGAEA